MGIKQTKRQKRHIENIREGRSPSVSTNDLKIRRDICRLCDKASKSSDSKYSIFKGLYFQSQCKASGMLLLECLTDPEFSCPINKF